MNKLKSVDNDEGLRNIDSVYEEVASFSGDELDMISASGIKNTNVGFKNLDQNINRNNCFNNLYKLKIKLYGSNDCYNHAKNGLILDNVGEKYSYVNDTASFNDSFFNPNFSSDGVLTKVFTRKSNKILDLTLNNSFKSEKFKSDYSDKKSDFKLSQIMNNIGNINNLIKSNHHQSANVLIKQDMVVLNSCGIFYAIFNFDLHNTGNDIAQKVLFKDVFPENILLNRKNIFLEGNTIKCSNVFLNRNKVIINLPNLNEGKRYNVTIVGRICAPMRNSNFAIISCVDNCFRLNNTTFTNMSQRLSNVKKI